jgi:outer membrane immunogenic protein
MRGLKGAALAACVMLFANVAAAADLGGPAPVGADGIPAHFRSGAYVGLVGGYDIAQAQADTFKFSDAAFMGGAFVGFQTRVNGVVIGLEADYLLTDIQATTGMGSVTINAKTNYLASVRARLGVTAGPALLYVTAGPAFTEHKVNATDGSMTIASKDFLVGGVFGAGVEMELTRTLFVRLEALHYIFPDKTVGNGVDFFNSKDQQTTARIGLGFRLN